MTQVMEASPRVLIVCIGNSLMADDAAGCEVYGLLTQKTVPGGVRLEIMGMAGIDLLDRFQGEHTLIIVDAVRFGAPPGAIHVLPWEEIPPARGLPVSAHGIGIRESIEIGRLLYGERMPEKVLLIGIEGSCFDVIGGPMTPEVRSSITKAADEVLRHVDLALKERNPVRQVAEYLKEHLCEETEDVQDIIDDIENVFSFGKDLRSNVTKYPTKEGDYGDITS